MSRSQRPVASNRGLLQHGRRIVIALIALAILLVYSNSLHNDFHFDDSHTVVDNPAIRSLTNLPHFFTDTSTFSVLPTNRTYRPVVTATLALDYALAHGLHPLWFHLDTLFVFFFTVLLVGKLFEVTFDRTEPGTGHFLAAMLGAAWFALHPAMAETVNYIIQRGDIYCTVGCLAALVFWVKKPQLRRYGLYLLPYVVALLSKPPAAVFPLLLLFWVYFFERPQQSAGVETEAARWKRSALAIVPSLLLTALLMRFESMMTPKSFMPSSLSPSLYRLTQPFVWSRYFGSLFLPLHLNVDSDLEAVSGLTPEACFGLLFMAALLGIILFTWRKQRWWPVTYGLLWFLLTQLPTSLYPLSEVENDHRMFFSFPGLMLAASWCLWRLWERVALNTTRRRVFVGTILLLLSAYAYGAHQRNAVWHDEESLWKDDVAKSPHNGRGLMTYGVVCMGKGNYAEALSLFERALRYTPNYSTLEVNLGIVNGALGHAQEAEKHFQRAIALTPGDDATYSFYGRWLLQQGRVEEAIHALQTALSLNPSRALQREWLIRAYADNGDEAEAHALALQTAAAFPGDEVAQNELDHPFKPDAAFWINRSMSQSQAGNYLASLHSAERALALDPHSAEALNNIGAAYGAMHQWEKAIAYEQQALDVQPSLQIARNNLIWYAKEKATPALQTRDSLIDDSLAFYRAQRFQDSILAARHALQLDPHSAEAWNNIAAGEAALHHWDAAIDAAQHAIQLKPEMQLAKNNLAWAQSQKNAGAH